MKERWKRRMIFVLMMGILIFLIQGCTAVSPKASYPRKPITIIEPWGPQSWGFLQAQELAAALEPVLGVKVLVEAKSGGASAVGTKFVKDSRPDGYTLLHGWIAGLVQVPLYESNPGYDVFNDFEFLAFFTESPVVALSKADKPWNTLAEFIQYVKANPNKSFAFSGGPALSVHSIFGGEIFRNAGVQVKGIYYDDAAAAGAAMLAGDVDVAFDSFSGLERYKGQVKALGVLAEHRYPGYENIPTVAEQGLESPTVPSWSGILAPKGLPVEVRDKLVQALKQVLTNKDFQAKIQQNMRWFVVYKGPEELKDYVKKSMEHMKGPVERLKAQQKK